MKLLVRICLGITFSLPLAADDRPPISKTLDMTLTPELVESLPPEADETLSASQEQATPPPLLTPKSGKKRPSKLGFDGRLLLDDKEERLRDSVEGAEVTIEVTLPR